MKEENKRVKKSINFDNLNDQQKLNCIKNLLYSEEINDALGIILEKEKKDLSLIKIIIDCLQDEVISEKVKANVYLKEENSVKTYVFSRIISYLSFYNKRVILKNFFESLTKEELKQLALYEYSNKTEVSISSDIFKKYCSKYEEKGAKKAAANKTEMLELTTEFTKYKKMTMGNKKRNTIIIGSLAAIVLLLSSILFAYKWNQDEKILSRYKRLILPGIYLNDISLEGMKEEDLKKVAEAESEKIKNGKLVISNVNGDYSFTYKDVGVEVNDEIVKEILYYNKNIFRFKKVYMIKNSNKKHKVFKLEGTFSDNVLDKFMVTLKDKLNTEPKEDNFYVNNEREVVYVAGASGFKLDSKKTKAKIKKAFIKLDEETKVEAEGEVKKVELKYTKYKDINKKVASYTTYFANAGNRGHNIVLAASKLNETLVEPGDTFSYIATVGPFSNGSGYLPAPVYLNNDVATGNGGGVCQLATTMYVVSLKTNVEVVQRQGHSFAPTYVPGGLDATIYSPSVDYKFKNPYEYPIFILAYARGNYLTVDFWTSDKALGNKTYEPYSYYSNGGYVTYVKEFEDGNYVSQRYVNKTSYKPHP